MGKIIAKTALITFLAIIVLIGAVGGMFIWLAPETVAKSCESLGFDSLSLKMYERTYKKDKTINNLHRVVDKSILFGGDETLLKYYPEFESHKDYEKFIQALDEANYDENAKVIVNLKLSNEGNRLKTRYVSALAKDDFEKAFTYAANDLFGINVLEDDFHYCIVGLAKYLNRANAELFGDVEKGQGGKPVGEIIYERYVELKTLYDNSTFESNYEAAVMSSRLIDMLQFMLLIDSTTDAYAYNKVALTNDLEAIFADYKEYIA